MQTSQLQGAALDWAVELIERNGANHTVLGSEAPVLLGAIRKFSTDWAQGGPIIERENITVIRANSAWDGVTHVPVWFAETDKWVGHGINTSYEGANFDPCFMIDEESGVYGPTPLIAAMRCFVASKLGGNVQLPEGLE